MTCGKIIFATRAEAERSATRLRERKKGHSDLWPYFCKRCRGFHTGHRRHMVIEAERKRRRAIAQGGANA